MSDPEVSDATPPAPAECRELFARRLRAAELDTQRFIDVQDGEKGTYDHTQHEPDAAALTGNYGVYGGAGDGDDTGWILVDLDVDDYEGDRAPDWIPETLTVASPHTDGDSGGHFYVALPSGATDALEDAFGTANPNPPWGEIRVHNQYCVGPGSQLDGCSKEWCDDCADPDGGYYRLKSDAPIAQMQTDAFVAALADDMPDRETDDGEPGREQGGRTVADAYDDFDLKDYDPSATESDETTDDVRDVFAALDRLDARRVADKTIVHRWNDDATTSGNYRAFVPTWGTDANGTANIVDDRIWQDTGGSGYGGPVVMALIDANELKPRTASPPGGDLWWAGIDYLRDLGFSIPEYVPSTPSAEDDPEDLKRLDVTLDPAVAWRAAGGVRPGGLDTPTDLATTDDGWVCPRCEAAIDVVRAAAIDAGIVPDCSATLADDAYDRAYDHARRGLGAPLPEYVNHQMATERWDLVQGAIRQLEFGHLDEDAIASEITGRGDAVDGDAQLTLDPAWRDSDSGESVLVFPSGTVYEAHPDHDGVLDVLRFVALDSGAIDWDEFTGEEYQLTGETFRHVYETARRYGAPLPRWEGTDAYHTAVLPPADELIDDGVGDDDRLAAAYDAVADLYTDAAETDAASLLRVLPGLGKTEQVFRNATEYPVLYTAGRKELMADGVERAAENGASAYILPVFAENGPPREVKDIAERVLRENGQRLLRDRWSLVERVNTALPDGEQVPDPGDFASGGDDDEVHLERGSCPTANGEYGLDWWLAVHAARGRGYRPQQIHENAAALFGENLPCTCDDDDDAEDGEVTCPYTAAWETATDPDDPFDVLIGHYTHAHVRGARTYAERGTSRVVEDPRVVAVDEFPGQAYQRQFGDEFADLAAWLAGALREDVADRQDLLTNADDLWSDETVRAWLARDETSGEHGRIATALGSAENAIDALATAEWLLDERPKACADLGVKDGLEQLVDAHPEFDADAITTTVETLANAPETDGPHANTLRFIDDVRDSLNAVEVAGESITTDIATALADAPHVAGTLADLVTDAIEGIRDRDDTARRRLEAARTALQGGAAGCEVLAMHADDGYAHPLAHALLYGLLAPGDDDDVATVRTSNFTFGREEDTRLSSVGYHTNRVLIDRNHHGAVVNHPPGFTAGGGDNPAVGLDATGRGALWEIALGREVTTRDIHDTARERREFLRNVYGLQIVQTSPHANSYEGDPTGKNFDDDVEVVAEIGRQYSDRVGEDPAVLTTKVVEETLEDRLTPITSAIGHFGALNGTNALADHRLAALLGCQHYGDHVVELWAALAGEEANRTGHGMTLDYNSRIANTALQHMREDQVMQAALRFGRDSDGALVFAHTAALRDDLPVVADGEVLDTFTRQAQAIGEAASELTRRPRFTARDVLERVVGFDPSPRTVRRVLSDFVDANWLERTETPNGHANEFSVSDGPRPAEVELPDVESRAAGDPGQDDLGVYYTWSVRVTPGEPRPARHRRVGRAKLPAPGGGDRAPESSAPPG